LSFSTLLNLEGTFVIVKKFPDVGENFDSIQNCHQTSSVRHMLRLFGHSMSQQGSRTLEKCGIKLSHGDSPNFVLRSE